MENIFGAIVDEEVTKNGAHALWSMYSSLVKEGFLTDQAMAIILTMITTSQQARKEE